MNTDRAYKIVKFVGVKGKWNSGGYYWLYFGSKAIYSDSGVPLIDIKASQNYVPTIKNCFNSVATNLVDTEYEIYALYVGGHASYRCFIVLSEDWLVKPTAN